MTWTHIKPYGTDDLWSYWISGIYKIVTYNGSVFHAYYLREGDKNWGWYVCTPPDLDPNNHKCWRSLESAQAACERDAAIHPPTRAQAKRAAEVEATLAKEANVYLIAASIISSSIDAA